MTFLLIKLPVIQVKYVNVLTHFLKLVKMIIKYTQKIQVLTLNIVISIKNYKKVI